MLLFALCMKNAQKYTISRRKKIMSMKRFNLLLSPFTTPSFKMTYAYITYAYMSAPSQTNSGYGYGSVELHDR